MIKIEHPTRGDDTRAWGPPFAPYTKDSGLDGPGEAAYYLAVCVSSFVWDGEQMGYVFADCCFFSR